jgi:hypothetical protein
MSDEGDLDLGCQNVMHPLSRGVKLQLPHFLNSCRSSFARGQSKILCFNNRPRNQIRSSPIALVTCRLIA